MNDIISKLFIKSYESFKTKGMNILFEQEDNNILHPSGMECGKYMSHHICNDIHHNMKFKKVIEYIFDSTKIIVEMFHKNKHYKFDKLIHLINYYVYTLNKINHNEKIILKLYLSDLKKQFPKTKKVLNEDNVNSGLTLFNGNERMIIIYRKEEIEKVLLHELVHYYGFDFHYYDNQYDNYFMNRFKIKVSHPYKNSNNPLALYESYTDTLACYGHIIANVLFKHSDKSTQIIQSLITDQFIKEKQYYMKQARKVLRYGSLKENTHCFSYYICKAVLFKHFDKFIRFIENNGIDIGTHKEKQEKFIELLKACLEDDKFWKSIGNNNSIKNNMHSLRMTKLIW